MTPPALADTFLAQLARYGAVGAALTVEWPDGRAVEVFRVRAHAEAPRRVEARVGERRGVLDLWHRPGAPAPSDDVLRELLALVVAALPAPVHETENEAIVRALFEASQDAIGVSVRGVHKLVNDAYLRLFGYERAEDLLARPIFDLIEPAEREQIAEYVRRRAAGEPVPGSYETRGLRRDGTAFDMDVHVSTYDHRGERYTLVVLRDVTERNRAEEALRASREFYRAVFEVNTAVKLLIDPDDGAIVDANQAACTLYGYSLEQLRRLRITDINTLPPHEVEAEMARARTARRTWFKFPHRLADGRIRKVEVHSGPVQVNGRSLLLSIVHDVTERDELEEQLRQSQKMEAVGRLAGGVAHDFNNLLTVMIGYADGLAEELPADSTLRANAQELLQAGLRAEQLTRRLLAFSRRQPIQTSTLRVDELVLGLEALLARILGPEVTVELDLAAAAIDADPAQIEQVLMNLAVNARDAMPHGGRFVVRCVDHGDRVELSIADTGLGMDDETRARAFEPFFTTKAQGTGLGLSTVYGIVTQSGGEIAVSSVPGAGTRFTVRFPRALPDAPVPRPPVPQGAQRGTGTLLVVEDQDEVRMFLVQRLRLAGYTVHEAPDAETALAVVEGLGGPIDLLVTDLVMPGLNGLQLYDALIARQPGLRAVFASGYAEEVIHDRALPTDTTAFLQKPFTGKTLLRTVGELLAGDPSRAGVADRERPV